MKKGIMILLAVTLVFAFLGCQSEDTIQPNYEVLVYGLSDSITDSGLQVEYKFNTKSEAEITPPETVEIEFQGLQLKGDLHGQIHKGSCNTYFSYLYRMGSDRFTIDENGNVTQFVFKYHTPTSDPVSAQQARATAEEFAAKIFDISLYDVSVKDNGVYYEIEFRKYIGSFASTDHATIGVDYTGKLFSYSAHMLGRVPLSTKVDDIQMDAVESAVTGKLDAIFAEEIELYQSVEYSNFRYQLTTLADGSRAMICLVDVHCYLEVAPDVVGRRGELISLVIILPQ